MKRLAVTILTSLLLPVLFVSTASASTGAAFVQGTGAAAGSSSSTSVYLTPHAGDMLVGLFRTSTAPSVSDTVNGAWREAAATPSSDGAIESLWYLPSSAGTKTKVKLSVAGSSQSLRMVVDEYSGARALDKAGCQVGTGTTAAAPTLSGTAAGELAYAAAGMYDHESVSAATPAVLRTTTSTSVGVNAGEDILSTTTANTGLSFAISPAPPGGWGTCEALFTTGATGTQTGGTAPSNTGLPTVSGTATQGSTLTTTSGSWSGSPTGYSYQWQSCNGSGTSCANISGATGASYALQSSDVGNTVRAFVVATNSSGSTSADSAVTAVIQASGTSGGGTGTSGGSTGGNGATSFDGTFGAPMSDWPNIYGSCYGVANSSEIQFNISSSCDPAGNGHYRTDLATGSLSGPGNVYPAGQVTCSTVPVQVVSAPGITDNTWLVFAEAVPAGYDGSFTAGWSFSLSNYWTGNSASSPNQFLFSVDDNGTNEYVWHGGTVDTGWHTLSVCSNNATDNTGEILGLWLDGARQTFNGGPCAGQQTCGGFPMITGSSYPLTIDDYTGGTPNQLNEGAPLIASMGSNGMPPEPSGGWNSP